MRKLLAVTFAWLVMLDHAASAEGIVLEPGQGLVVARILSTDVPVNMYFEAFEEIVVVDMYTGELGKIRLQQLPLLDGWVYISALPQGLYRAGFASGFKIINPSYGGTEYLSVVDEMGDRLGYFEVRPGRVTDLGTFFRTTVAPEEREDQFLVLAWSRDFRWQSDWGLETGREALSPMAIERLAAGSSVSGPPLGWVDGSIADRVSEGVEHYESRLDRFAPPTQLTGGRVVVPAEAGQLFVRSPEGAWETVQLDTRYTLHAVSELSDGSFAVGAGRGQIYFASELEGPWRREELPGTFAPTILVAELDGLGLSALVVSSSGYQLYRRSESSGWSPHPIEEWGAIESLFSRPVERSVDVAVMDGTLYLRDPRKLNRLTPEGELQDLDVRIEHIRMIDRRLVALTPKWGVGKFRMAVLDGFEEVEEQEDLIFTSFPFRTEAGFGVYGQEKREDEDPDGVTRSRLYRSASLTGPWERTGISADHPCLTPVSTRGESDVVVICADSGVISERDLGTGELEIIYDGRPESDPSADFTGDEA